MIQAASDKGNFRETNEDFVGYDLTANYGFYIVCDGIGGHKAGEVASKITVELMINYIKEFYSRNLAAHILESAMVKANKEVYEMAIKDEDYQGMGTTITCALDTGSTVYVGHMGDSSAYLIRNRTIAKLTKDHSVVQEMVDRGELKEEDRHFHPHRNVITKSLGLKEEISPEIMELDRSHFDYMLLCTDGLSEFISTDDIIKELYNEDGSENFARNLVNLAKANGSKDNISLVIFGGNNNDR